VAENARIEAAALEWESQEENDFISAARDSEEASAFLGTLTFSQSAYEQFWELEDKNE